MQFSFTILIAIAILAFGGGYFFKSSRITENFIQEQKDMLTNQIVTLEGKPYSFNRETNKLTPCQLRNGKNGTFSDMKCGR